MRTLALAKTVFAAVICGTGGTAGIALYPFYGPTAIWIAAGAIVLGFIVAAIPVSRRGS